MAIEIKTREELEKELAVKQQNLAVVESKIKELSSELGVEPTVEAVKQALTELEKSKKELEVKIDQALKKVETLHVSDSDSSEIEGNTLSGTEGKDSEVDEFNED